MPGAGVESTMTADKKIKHDNGVYIDANNTAHTMSKDPGVKTQNVSGEAKTSAKKTGPGDSPVVPHDMDHDITTSINQMKLICPRCGESKIRAEFPDKYEVWIKCSSCNFFMGMSDDDWHRMKNSPNLNERIKKMAEKKGLLKG